MGCVGWSVEESRRRRRDEIGLRLLMRAYVTQLPGSVLPKRNFQMLGRALRRRPPAVLSPSPYNRHP